MTSMGAIPRILADDIMLLTTGPDHLELFTDTFTATHKYLQDLGSQIAPTKSLTFSTLASTRKQLIREIRANNSCPTTFYAAQSFPNQRQTL